MITYHLVTLFPESTDSYLNASILKRAQEKGLVRIKHYNPRDFVLPKNNKPKGKSGKVKLTYADCRVDDRPYGGGPGMVIEAMPIIRTLDKILKGIKKKSSLKIVFFSPSGRQFDNKMADTFKKYTDIIFICGRYEGIDARIKKAFPMIDISIGPYVLTGGELPAMIMIDAITRRIQGVLGDDVSVEERRVASPDVYTRPEVIEYKGKRYRVPKILLSGHHAKIEDLRSKKAPLRHLLR